MKKEFVFNRTEDPMTTTSNFVAGIAGMPRLEELIGAKLVDPAGEEIGTVHCIWEDTRRQSAFLGVKTGWLGLGSIHAVPSFSAEFSRETNTVRVPFTRDIVKNAPSFEEEEELSEPSEKEIFDFYSNRGVDMSGQAQKQPPQSPSPSSEIPPRSDLKTEQEGTKPQDRP